MTLCRDCGLEFEPYHVDKISPVVCRPCRKLLQEKIRQEIPIPRAKYRGQEKAENTHETKYGGD
jgi:hypothetical protein